MWDQHLHTHFSGDSEASSESIVQAALQKGLNGICFTDHLDYDYREEPGLFLLDIETYQKEIAALKVKYQDILPIHWGIEIGLQEHLAEENMATANAYPFDFIIGSTHCIDTVDIYYPSFFLNYSPKEAVEKYYEATHKNIKTQDCFDVYGHLDYIVRYLPMHYKNMDLNLGYKDFSDWIDQILKDLIYAGKGIEMNMAGFKYGLGHPNPTEDILKRYRELGGEIITVGSDGHEPAHVAFAFDQASSILLDAGFHYYSVFEKRKAEFIKLQ